MLILSTDIWQNCSRLAVKLALPRFSILSGMFCANFLTKFVKKPLFLQVFASKMTPGSRELSSVAGAAKRH
jgi:hypothetical protein